MIEALVVVSVVAVLIGLLLPAAQSAREAARRIRCANNLKQIGIGLLAYHEAIGCLPPGRFFAYDPRYVDPSTPCLAGAPDKSFLVHLLPFVEQAALHGAVNHDLAILAGENRTVLAASVGIFACPSDPAAGRPRVGYPFGRLPTATGDPFGHPALVTSTSYAGCHGSFGFLALPEWADGRCRPSPDRPRANGTITDVSPIGYKAIRDGLSNTIVVAEQATTPLLDLNPFEPFVYEQRGWWAVGHTGDTLFTAAIASNVFRRTKPSGRIRHSWVESASSLHPGGLNALMADGSVRFIAETIDSWPMPLDGFYWSVAERPGVWQALATRDGGELIP